MAPKVDDWSVTQYAELRGLTSQRIYQLIQAGMPHRRRKNTTRIVPKEAIAWEIERAKEGAKPADVAASTPMGRKTLAEAEFKELQVQQLRGALVPVEEFEELASQLIGGFAAVAGGQLQRFERDMVALSTPGEARKLSERIHQALMSGAQAYADQLEQEASEPDPEPEQDAAA